MFANRYPVRAKSAHVMEKLAKIADNGDENEFMFKYYKRLYGKHGRSYIWHVATDPESATVMFCQQVIDICKFLKVNHVTDLGSSIPLVSTLFVEGGNIGYRPVDFYSGDFENIYNKYTDVYYDASEYSNPGYYSKYDKYVCEDFDDFIFDDEKYLWIDDVVISSFGLCNVTMGYFADDYNRLFKKLSEKCNYFIFNLNIEDYEKWFLNTDNIPDKEDPDRGRKHIMNWFDLVDVFFYPVFETEMGGIRMHWLATLVMKSKKADARYGSIFEKVLDFSRERKSAERNGMATNNLFPLNSFLSFSADDPSLNNIIYYDDGIEKANKLYEYYKTSLIIPYLRNDLLTSSDDPAVFPMFRNTVDCIAMLLRYVYSASINITETALESIFSLDPNRKSKVTYGWYKKFRKECARYVADKMNRDGLIDSDSVPSEMEDNILDSNIRDHPDIFNTQVVLDICKRKGIYTIRDFLNATGLKEGRWGIGERRLANIYGLLHIYYGIDTHKYYEKNGYWKPV